MHDQLLKILNQYIICYYVDKVKVIKKNKEIDPIKIIKIITRIIKIKLI